MQRYELSHRSNGMGYETSLIETKDGNLVKISEIEEKLNPLRNLVENYNGESGSDCLKIIRTVLTEITGTYQ